MSFKGIFLTSVFKSYCTLHCVVSGIGDSAPNLERWFFFFFLPFFSDFLLPCLFCLMLYSHLLISLSLLLGAAFFSCFLNAGNCQHFSGLRFVLLNHILLSLVSSFHIAYSFIFIRFMHLLFLYFMEVENK